MSQSPEDYSFFIYASPKKGIAITNPTNNRAEAIVRQLTSTGTSVNVPMRDDGICKL